MPCLSLCQGCCCSDLQVPQSLYPTLATVLLLFGILSTVGFFMWVAPPLVALQQPLPLHHACPCCCRYEVTKTRHTRKLSEEALLGGISSISLVSFIIQYLLWHSHGEPQDRDNSSV